MKVSVAEFKPSAESAKPAMSVTVNPFQPGNSKPFVPGGSMKPGAPSFAPLPKPQVQQQP